MRTALWCALGLSVVLAAGIWWVALSTAQEVVPCDHQLVVAAQYVQQLRDGRDQAEYQLAQERVKVLGLTRTLQDLKAKPPPSPDK